MGITAGESATRLNGSGTNHLVTMPANVVAGDVLVACLDLTSDPAVVTPPGGWTLVPRPSYAAMYYRVADGTEGVTQTWTTGTATASMTGCRRYSGVDTSHPLDCVGVASHGTSTSVSAPGVTTVTNAAMVVACIASAAGITETNALTQVYDLTDGPRNFEYDDGIQAVAGPTGNLTWTVGFASSYVIVVALRPAIYAPAGPPPRGDVASAVPRGSISLATPRGYT